MTANLLTKERLRKHFLKVRETLSTERREAASFELITMLAKILAPQSTVLSFFSFGHELDTTRLNSQLAYAGRLLLPKMVGDSLSVYRVSHPEMQCSPNAFGILEPDPKSCPLEELSSDSIILVPALAFDHNNHRLGYGKGCYDRLLASFPGTKLGIGFREQRCETLPTLSHDLPLSRVLLF